MIWFRPGAGLLGGVWAAARACFSSLPSFTRASTLPSREGALAAKAGNAANARAAQLTTTRMYLVELMDRLLLRNSGQVCRDLHPIGSVFKNEEQGLVSP